MRTRETTVPSATSTTSSGASTPPTRTLDEPSKLAPSHSIDGPRERKLSPAFTAFRIASAERGVRTYVKPSVSGCLEKPCESVPAAAGMRCPALSHRFQSASASWFCLRGHGPLSTSITSAYSSVSSPYSHRQPVHHGYPAERG